MKQCKKPFDIYEYLKELSRFSKNAPETDEQMKQVCQEFERSMDNMSEEEKEKLRGVFVKCDEDAKADRAYKKKKSVAPLSKSTETTF